MNKKNQNYYVAIMAGGIGSRFWPKSRISKPKQFLDILNNGKTLLQSTYERFLNFIPENNIYVVTSKDYTHLVIENLPNLPKENILSEVARKNTAPCIAYVSFKINEINPSATVICSPADHLIEPVESFQETCLKALEFASSNEETFVTIGIQPTHPNTGFGYIQFIPEDLSSKIYKVKTFTEKPNLEVAQQFISSGDFLWNSGIFIANNSTLLNAFEKYLPDMYDLFNKHKTLFNTQLENSAIEKIYPQCNNISFDYGIMEKCENVFTLPANFNWNDLGTWNSLYDLIEKSENKNVFLSTPVIAKHTNNTIVSGNSNKLIVVEGLDNYIVVDTPDALLIFPKNREQEIKTITENLKSQKLDKFL